MTEKQPSKAALKQLELIKRGAEDIISEEELLKRIDKSIDENKPLKVKAGFDPTAPDIHLGHTVLLKKLRDFQDLGHTVQLVIGDFTASIGDPTGRNETRPPLTRDEVLKNAETYKHQAFKVLDKAKTETVYNSTWIDKLSVSDLIEVASKHTVARMLERDDFSKRYKEGRPISIHEFLYPLMQGYDSVALCSDIELGGTDQLFNLLVGRQLQKEYGQKPQLVLTVPLLEGLDGVQKMSKSYGNYIGITEAPNEIFGKVMSVSDKLMMRYYDLLSSISMDEYNDIKSGKTHPKEAKEALAGEITARFYSKDDAEAAKVAFKSLFEKKLIPDDIETVELSCPEDTLWIAKIMVDAGLCKSTSEAMRLVTQGGVKVGGEKVTDKKAAVPTNTDFLLQVGKRHFRNITFIKP